MESGLVPSTHARPLESRLAPTPTLASSESLTNPFAYHPFALVTKRAGGIVGPFPRLGFRMVWMTTRFYVSQVATFTHAGSISTKPNVGVVSPLTSAAQ